MATAEEAQAAIQKLHGFAIEGRNLTVNEARPKEERPPRQFEGGERRGGFGGPRGDRGDRRGGDRGGFRR
jgi:RNA recognition motif-containing protein